MAVVLLQGCPSIPSPQVGTRRKASRLKIIHVKLFPAIRASESEYQLTQVFMGTELLLIQMHGLLETTLQE